MIDLLLLLLLLLLVLVLERVIYCSLNFTFCHSACRLINVTLD